MNNKSLEELTLKDIDKYAAWLTAEGFKPKTYRCKLSTVKSFVNYLWINDLITFRPEQVIMPKFRESDQEANFLTQEEAAKLLSVVTDIRDRAMVLVLISTCTRVSEFTDLRIDDLYERSLIVRNGKGGKRRLVFLNAEANLALKKYLKTTGHQTGYLFPNRKGNQNRTNINPHVPLSRVVVAKKVRHYARLAGFTKKVTTHTLRHTGATLILRGGARVEETQKILGHANIRTTMIYLHFTDEGLHEVFDKSMKNLKTLA